MKIYPAVYFSGPSLQSGGFFVFHIKGTFFAQQSTLMEQVRTVFGVPAKRGGRVIFQSDKIGRQPQSATIASATPCGHLKLRFEGHVKTYPAFFHPAWGLTYL